MRLLMKTASALLAAAAVALAAPMTAQAAAKTSPTVATGNDVSWPQCVNDGGAQGPLPQGQAFAIVGLNDGRANTTNPCFNSEWDWAQGSTGATKQPKAAVYVNTANPELLGSWWPKDDYAENDPTVVPVPKGYNNGVCDGSASAACAFVYGWSKAYDDVHLRGLASATGVTWWLDVETGNSWSSSNLVANRADLEAMTTVFQNASGPTSVGIYSTRYQFGVIAGSVTSGPLLGLNSWLPGASGLKGAQSNCRAQPLTTGSTVTLTQYTSGGFDYDVSCIG